MRELCIHDRLQTIVKILTNARCSGIWKIPLILVLMLVGHKCLTLMLGYLV